MENFVKENKRQAKVGLDTDTLPSQLQGPQLANGYSHTTKGSLRLHKDTTLLGQSNASKGEFKDKQALKA